jgi:GGDEF domain-containing protein
MHRLAALVLGALLLTGAGTQARQVLDLDPARPAAELQDWGDFLIDGTGQLQLGGVLARTAGWQPTRPVSSYPLRQGEVLWIRFTVPPAPDAQAWYLQLPRPGLDLATLYTRAPEGNWTGQSSGDALPMSAWALPHLYPVLPLAVSAADPTYYMLRVQSGDGFRAPLQFVSASRLSAQQQHMSLLYGVYFGLLAMSGIFALATSAVLRDGAYFALGIWALAATAAVSAAVGVAGLHLWPEQSHWSDAAPYVLPALCMSPLLLFVAEALRVRERAVRIYAVALVLAVAAAAAAVGTVRTEGAARLTLLLVTLGVAWAGAVGLIAWAWWRGDPFARRLMLALAPLPLALLAQWPGLYPPGWPDWAQGDELILLALGLSLPGSYLLLALRSQERRDHRRRIAQLSEIDPATGLINDVVFVRRMQGLIERSARFDMPGVVAVVEFSNMDALWKEFGRKHALEMLLRLAERLMSIVRNVDTVARVGSSRFGLLVEGPLTTSRARAFAAKIIANCITPMAGLPQGMVVRPRVAIALVPQHGEQPQQVMQRLERMLAEPADAARSILFVESAPAELAPPPAAQATPAHEAPTTALSDWQPTAALKGEQTDKAD